MTLVIDASVAIKWFVREPDHERALMVLECGEELVAPDLLLPECGNSFRKKCKGGEVTQEQAARAIKVLPGFFSKVIPSAELIEEALTLAHQLDHSVYDCMYLVCARREKAKLISADAKFVKKAKSNGFGDYIDGLEDWAEQYSGALSVPLSTIEEIADLSHKFRQSVDNIKDQLSPGNERFKAISSEYIGLAFRSPHYVRLKRLLARLPREQIADLLALGWFGRKHEFDDWDHCRRRAQDHIGHDWQTYFTYVLSCMGEVWAGYKRLQLSQG